MQATGKSPIERCGLFPVLGLFTMEKLKISHYLEHTKVLGPYDRSALWVHGCCFACDGCIAAEMNRKDAVDMDVTDLAEIFLQVKDTEGITISGGEPFLQAAPLCRLIRKIRNERDYGVILYTGFTRKELQDSNDGSRQELLSLADVIIDGRYERALDDGKAYRGSSNQNILLLTDRYRDVYEEYYLDNERRNIEISVMEDHVYMAGVPSVYGLQAWRDFKRKAGCEDV